MKITVQDEEFIHIYDDSVKTTVKDGIVDEGYTDAHGAIDAALILLCNFYDEKTLIEDIKEGQYSIM